jgi:hypothetical protein
MASTAGDRAEPESNPAGNGEQHPPAPVDKPPRVSDAQLRAAARVLDSRLPPAPQDLQQPDAQ